MSRHLERIVKISMIFFFSHSYLDKTLVYAVVDLFNQAGYSVYVDWIEDQQLDRSKVTAATANTYEREWNYRKA